MATFGEVLRVAIERGTVRIQKVNGNVMEVSRATKKRSPFLKIGTSDETVSNYLAVSQKEVGFLIHIDGDLLNQIAKEIDHDKEVNKTE